MLLAKMKYADKDRWTETKQTLDKFGRDSGLFDKLTLKTLGHTDSDSFQILLKIAGPNTNLIDVGYGVSQVLPIVVDLIAGVNNRFYLLQQPEIHLHPSAQAELGTFLTRFAHDTDNKVIIETHSDHLIDRIRMEVRDRDIGISHDDISILYFERDNLEVVIHELRLDENGNITNAPRSYRTFFLSEEKRLFGI